MSKAEAIAKLNPQSNQNLALNGNENSTVTVLRCHDNLRLTKSYTLTDGRIVENGYCRAKWFSHSAYSVSSLMGLFNLLNESSQSQHVCLIRGLPADELPSSVRRTGENFPMQDAGASWVCLDFDGVALPGNIDPYSREGVDYVVRQLPPEFRSTSYIAQFSASAGILHADGTPYKIGLRAHVFFWLDRPITNEELKGWLFDYPVDNALFTAVQPHYICNPILGSGVQCVLRERLYMAKRPSDSVRVPDLSRFARTTISYGPPGTEWIDPPGGLPDFDDLLTCEFIEWYVSNPHHEGERYEATRAFAHNLRRIESIDWEALLHQLIPDDFPYTDTIISSAESSRPLTCEHIYQSAYRCPRYNTETGKCCINQHARTPYRLAHWIKKDTNHE